MLIQGSICSNKTELLLKYYLDLLSNGISEEQILVILSNSYKKADFIKNLPQKIDLSKNIFTFQGICYNAFFFRSRKPNRTR